MPTKILHHSERKQWKRCRLKWYFGYHLGLQPKTPDKNLWLGAGIHKSIEAYYHDNKDPLIFFQNWAKDERNEIGEALGWDISSDLEKKLDKAEKTGCAMLKYYLANFPKEKDDFKVVETELYCEVWLRTPRGTRAITKYGLTIDKLVEKDKKLWVGELKTAASFPENLELDEQITGYIWGVQQSLDVEIHGVLYDIMRKVDPYNANSKPPFFKRDYVWRNQEEIKNAGLQLYFEAEDIRRASKHFSKLFRNPTKDCAWDCPFKDLCVASLDGADLKMMIDSNFNKRQE